MIKPDDFLRPKCSFKRLDIFISRRGILNALTEQLPNFHGTLLDIGCGRMPYKPILLAPPSRIEKYIGLDLQVDSRDGRHGAPDLEWDGRKIPLESASVDCAISTEVYELCTDVEIVMRETARVLKPNGMLFFTVPFFWPVFDSPYDQYRFTPFALERHLKNAGFHNIKMKSLGGWDASLAQMIGLWVRRRPMGKWKRRIFTILAAPIFRLLVKLDNPPPIFTDQTMITDIAGTAIKQ